MINVFFSSFLLVLFHRNDRGQDDIGPKVPTLLPVQSFSQYWFFTFAQKNERKKMLARWKGEMGREREEFIPRSVFFYFSSSVILNCHSQDKQTKNRFGASSRWIWVGRTFPAFIENRTRMHSPSWVHARTCTHTLPRAPTCQTSALRKVKARLSSYLWACLPISTCGARETCRK